MLSVLHAYHCQMFPLPLLPAPMAFFPQGTQNEVLRLSAEQLVHDAAGVTQTLEQALCHKYVQDSGTQQGIFPALTPLMVMPVLSG